MSGRILIGVLLLLVVTFCAGTTRADDRETLAPPLPRPAITAPFTVLEPVAPPVELHLDGLPRAYREAVLAILRVPPGKAASGEARAARDRAATLAKLPDVDLHDLAYTLVLIRSGDVHEAGEVLDGMLARPGTPHLPVWAAAVHLHVRGRDAEAILETTRRLVTRAREIPDESARQGIALWTGRVVGGVHAGTTTRERKDLEALAALVRASWRTLDDRETHDAGVAHVAEESARLHAEADALVAEATHRTDRLDEAYQSRVEDARREIAVELADRRDDLLAETDAIDDGTRRIAEEVRYLDQRLASLSASILLARRELTRATFAAVEGARRERQRRQRQPPGRPLPPSPARVNGAGVVAVNALLQGYLAEYVVTVRRRRTLAAVVESAVRERSRRAGRFEMASRAADATTLAFASESAHRVRTRDDRIRRDTATRRAADLRRRSRRTSTYLAFDVAHEIRLLTEQLTPPPEPGAD